jgi:hypothetical protein
MYNLFSQIKILYNFVTEIMTYYHYKFYVNQTKFKQLTFYTYVIFVCYLHFFFKFY